MVKISSPGRICLFGEHQDYLGLPIIAAAISKRITVQGAKRSDNKILIDLPDINESEYFEIQNKIPYLKERDYLRSSVNVLIREGYSFSKGIDCKVTGDIPINSGTSSSSALITSWINFLVRMSDQSSFLQPEKIAELAYKAEVLEFSEPGGIMDHYSTAIGNVIWLESFPEIKIKKYSPRLGAFVLGDSKEPKDTKAILARVKYGVLKILEELKRKYSNFSLHNISSDELGKFKSDLSDTQFELLVGTIKNRDFSFFAKKLFESETLDHIKIGSLLNLHQNVLRDIQKISTKKIDSMIDTALNAGALGAKINGSGGGGCMFAYAPNNPEKVLEAVKKIASDSFIVNVDEGTRLEN